MVESQHVKVRKQIIILNSNVNTMYCHAHATVATNDIRNNT